jgi:type I restriction enzyme S subunit
MKIKTIEQNGFKKTEIGLIPEDWKAVELGDEEYFEILSSGIDKFDNSKKYLSTSSIEWDKIIAVECDITYKNRPLRANMQPKIDTVWFAKMKNTIKVYTFTGKNKADINEYILSTGFAGTLCNKNKAEPKYLEKVFLSTWFNRIKDTLAHGSTQKAVNNQDIKKILIPMPPLPEQQKISSVLSKIQQAIEQQDEIIEKTKELKKSLMNKLFTEGLSGEQQKETETGLIPNSWEVVKLGNICDYTTGKLNSEAAKEDGIYPFFTCSQETYRINSYSFDQEALLLSGNNARGIYSVKYYKGKFDVYQRTYVLTIRNGEKVDYIYLSYDLSRKLDFLRENSLGSTTKYLTAGIIKGLKISLPPIEEQKEIADILSNVDKKIQQAESRKQTLQALFKTMLNQLMTGRIRVKDLDIEIN